MMSYYIYNPLMTRLETSLWHSHYFNIKKKDRGENTLRQSVRFLLQNDNKIYGTIDLPILLEEYLWLQNRQVIFPQDTQVINRLLKAGARIKNAQQLFLNDKECFVLALPKSFLINNTRPSGVLVYLDHWNTRETLVNDFFNWISLPAPDAESEYSDIAICITYQMPHSTKDMYYRAIIPIHLVDDLINAKSPQEYWEILGYIDRKKETEFAFELDLHEISYQQTIVKLVLAILLYKKSVPDCIQSGYPINQKPKFSTVVINKYKPNILSMPKAQHESPEAHYRSWHFKQLFAERYYQNEYKDYPRGSRIIFVRDTFVNLKDIDARTLK